MPSKYIARTNFHRPWFRWSHPLTGEVAPDSSTITLLTKFSASFFCGIFNIFSPSSISVLSIKVPEPFGVLGFLGFIVFF